jgi:hypothetical protein
MKITPDSFKDIHLNCKFPTDKNVLLLQEVTLMKRVILVKLTGSQLVKKFPTFYGTGKFVTACTIARHLSLS